MQQSPPIILGASHAKRKGMAMCLQTISYFVQKSLISMHVTIFTELMRTVTSMSLQVRFVQSKSQCILKSLKMSSRGTELSY